MDAVFALTLKDALNGAEGMRYDSRIGQSGHSVANDSHDDVSSELRCPSAKPQRYAPLLVTRFGEIPRVSLYIMKI